MAFNHVVFPLQISALESAVQYLTTIVSGKNAQEVRNAEWQDPLLRFNAGFAVRSYEDINTLVSFFHICKGREKGFLLKNEQDYTVDEWTEVTETVTTSLEQYQLYKEYTVSVLGVNQTYQRTINRVDATSVQLREAGTPMNYTVSYPPGANEFTVDWATGRVSYQASAGGATVDFKVGTYYIPVRFDTDILPINLMAAWLNAQNDQYGLAEIPNIPIIEVREDF